MAHLISEGGAVSIETVDGPPLPYEVTAGDPASCAEPYAVKPRAFGATTKGVVLSAGTKCDGATAVET